MPLKSHIELEEIEHERLNSLINSMADAVVAVDEAINVVMFNGAALNILNVNNIASGTALSNLLKPINQNGQAVDITEMVKRASVPITNRDLLIEYSDQSRINLYVSIAPVRLSYGEQGQQGFVLLLRDITREKSLEEERDEFISVVSHELRTPIAIAEGNLSNALMIAARDNIPADYKKIVDDAHKQVLFLASMINDLSTLSRAERGVLKVDVEGINVHKLVSDLKDSYDPEAQQKGIAIKVVIDPSLELLYSSQLYVHEILQNFMTNALKYTSRGEITVEAKSDPGGAFFAVSDSGIGISKADQERVFDKFFRSEDYRTRQAKGTGLGLYVTMKLARLIHASVNLKSELNRGSTFSILIPNLEPAKASSVGSG